MVRASRSQLPASSGAVAAIWPRMQAGAEIVALEGGIGVGPQGGCGFCHRPRLALDLGLQLDRRIRQFVAFKGLVGGLRRHKAERQRGAEGHGANQNDHDGAPGRGPRPRIGQKCAKR